MKAHVSMSYGLVTLLLVMISLWCIEAMVQATMPQLEVQQPLKQLNRPAIKSIKSPDGDIIDCVHISHQPAFDHPLLKNHTIQMRPSFHPLGLDDEKEVASKMEASSIRQPWLEYGRCPEDTIPIRRNKKDAVLRASSIKQYGKKSHGTIPNPKDASKASYEFAYLFLSGGSYYGIKGTMNVWNPEVERLSDISVSQFWIAGGPAELLNAIQAGWHVYPDKNGDNKTRLFIYWTNDHDRSSGCYNLLCPGFVQVNNKIALGAFLDPVSTYGGRQYEITLLIWKDPKTGNWWLQYGNLSPLGYWPSSLFPYLQNGGWRVAWGGEIVSSNSNGHHTTTQMGSGHFSREGFGKAAYIRNFRIVDKSNKLQDPQGILPVMTSPNCYDSEKRNNGYFYFGGPGRNPDCP